MRQARTALLCQYRRALLRGLLLGIFLIAGNDFRQVWALREIGEPFAAATATSATIAAAATASRSSSTAPSASALLHAALPLGGRGVLGAPSAPDPPR